MTLAADVPGQILSLPVFRFKGSGEGPAVYIQAALHAHEMPGTVALDRLVPRLQNAEKEARLAGDITVVPHANPIGLAQAVFGETLGRFDINERINFNRSFPAGTVDSLEGRPASERLKAILLDMALSADVVLDLHCDDEGPVYLYVAERQLDEGLRLARAIGASVILTDASAEPVSFDTEVARRWTAEEPARESRFAATVELRGMLDVTPALAGQDAEGLYRYLVDIGSVADALPTVDRPRPVVGDVDAAVLIPTPVPGALLYDVEVGDWVIEGQRLVVVLSPFEAAGHEICAPFDGLVMTRRDRRLARRGEGIIKILRHPHP